MFAQLNGTLRPQSGAALMGLPKAISPHLFQEIWFALDGLCYRTGYAVPPGTRRSAVVYIAFFPI